MIIRTYSKLITLDTFEERFRYLALGGRVGEDTFGFERWLNQVFYHTKEWQRTRTDVIIRDFGCDLAMLDREIKERIIVHHMNPISVDDILNRTEYLLNPEFLVCTVDNTHKAIHYADESLMILDPIQRRPNDTCPWKK